MKVTPTMKKTSQIPLLHWHKIVKEKRRTAEESSAQIIFKHDEPIDSDLSDSALTSPHCSLETDLNVLNALSVNTIHTISRRRYPGVMCF